MSESADGRPRDIGGLVARVLDGARRVLVVGEGEADRGAALGRVLDELERRGVRARLLSANPGSPVLGPPGAVALGRREGGAWRVERIEALCTLDAARFRLPLVLAARRLLDEPIEAALLVSAPSVSRGLAAEELRAGFCDALGLGEVVRLDVLEAGRAAADRRRRRTELWDAFLEGAIPVELNVGRCAIGGAPPPADAPGAWPGRQVALLDADGRTRALGEALRLEREKLTLVAPAFDPRGVAAIVARDARRVAGFLVTERRPALPSVETTAVDLDARPRPSSPSPPVLSLASAKVRLVNGVLGDPLLHVRMRHRRRSLLFDLGEAGRLQGRIVHQVSDVFITHAHFDHIGGFPWLLRACIGSPGLRRLWGPPGLARHVEGTIAGILWDRIGERGPAFEVGELHGDRLQRFRLRAGAGGVEVLGEIPCPAGVLVDEGSFSIRAVTLDHGVPVLAFAFEEGRALHVRREALLSSGLRPGSWLSRLKESVLAGRGDEEIVLPDGSRRAASDLESELLLERPGQKLVYATDLDDSAANRRLLTALARGAHLFYCEASFAEEDAALARATQHLTARACGEVAAASNVDWLVPFHFSKRYDHEPSRIYRQVAEVFPRLVVATSSGSRSRGD